jgi:hypothetical protein
VKYAQLENTYINVMSHEEDVCTADVCPIHKRTDHHMRHFRQLLNFKTNIMYRACTHGFKHPDPDDPSVISGEYIDDHECDACCFRFATEEECTDGNNH